MKHTFILLVLICSYTGFSQETEKSYKNEIGINIAPFLTPLFVEDGYPLRYEISFVHELNDHLNLRLRGNWVNLNPDKGIEPPTLPFRVDTLSANSGEIVTMQYGQHRMSAYKLFFSTEYEFSLGPVNLYGGIGLAPGVVKNASYAYETTYYYDNDYQIFRRGMSAYAGSEFRPTFVFSAAPYLGINIPVGERFLINFQSSVEWNYYMGKLHAYDTQYYYKNFYGEFTAWPLTGEIGVYWRY